ncbi:P-loop containing nucleoside triphosphate hydrolase protein [Massarina eburnea CBS 473.64]|uniref:RNA helicase n=1 Tax=Massarina eburnea CBS 473.64 TaxID=1395130 RepID=A0A6A6S0P7_9PLEO|nr:P-loop containing nucleoside triphosphate hydrolase protein [Massarina eburnea CBS 473.64]
MLCKLSLLALVAASVETVLAADVPSFKLYAYGTGIKSGLRLFYGDGHAYVGHTAPTFVKEAVNITITANENSTEFVAAPDVTVEWESSPTLYVDTTAGAINPIGFIKQNETLPEGATAIGFGLYGGWAYHRQEESDIQMKFIATPTNETGIYQRCGEMRYDFSSIVTNCNNFPSIGKGAAVFPEKLSGGMTQDMTQGTTSRHHLAIPASKFTFHTTLSTAQHTLYPLRRTSRPFIKTGKPTEDPSSTFPHVLCMSKRPNPEDVSVDSIRLRSRQAYLEKRQQTKLIELERQVAEESEEIRSNPNLSKRELRDFTRNRETLTLAKSRLAIDEGTDGYLLPDAELSQRKEEVLNKRHNEYKTENDLWEEEQSAKAKAAQVQSSSNNVDDYEFVFDPAQEVAFVSDGNFADPKKQALQAQLDAAEHKARSIDEVRKSLPIYAYKDQFVEAVDQHQVIILLGETGSGKSTQAIQFLRQASLDGKLGIDPSLKIACTQPRRVAAMSVAQRVAEEMGVRIGKEVGFQVRFEDKTSENTKLVFMTDGMLLRHCLASPDFADFSVLIIDEAHERTLATDIVLGLLRDITRYRPDLKIIIASATLNAQSFSRFFSDAPIFSVPGRSWPVEIFSSSASEANYLSAAVTTLFQIHISTDEPGDILVFLTGEEEIVAAAQNIEETARKLGSRCKELIVCPIYAALPQEEQMKVFAPTPPKARKVVLSTNIAETSLTIDGIRSVIDCGFQKTDYFHPRTGMQTLVIEPISKASANQRAGRAGRTGPGRCFRLYTKFSFHNELPESTPPQIQRAPLENTCLLLKSLGIEDLINFDFMDPPSPDALIAALESLYEQGAIGADGRLTKLGRQLNEFPMDIRMSKAIVAANKHGCVEEMLTIVAMLPEANSLWISVKDRKVHVEAAKRRFISAEGGDFITLANIYAAWEEAEFSIQFAKENFLQQKTLTRARDVREQIKRLTDRVEVESSSCGLSDHVTIRRALVDGFFSKAARMGRDGQSYRTLKGAGGQSIFIHPSSVCNEPTSRPKWMIFFELVQTSKDFARCVCPIEPAWLAEAAPHVYKQEDLEKLGMDKKISKGKGKVGVDGR